LPERQLWCLMTRFCASHTVRIPLAPRRQRGAALRESVRLPLAQGPPSKAQTRSRCGAPLCCESSLAAMRAATSRPHPSPSGENMPRARPHRPRGRVASQPNDISDIQWPPRPDHCTSARPFAPRAPARRPLSVIGICRERRPRRGSTTAALCVTHAAHI